MKNGKAAGMDTITSELLKADIETTYMRFRRPVSHGVGKPEGRELRSD